MDARRSVPTAWLKAFFAGSTLLSASAQAQIAGPAVLPTALSATRRFELSWTAPPGCPGQDEVGHEVDDLIAESSGAPRPAPILAQASVTRERDGFALALAIHDTDFSSNRHIGAPTCEELGHATALVLAMAVDPTILERRASQQDPAGGMRVSDPARCNCHCRLSDLPLPSTPRRHTSPANVVTAPQPEPILSASEPLYWRLGVGAVGAMGVLPGFNLGLSLLGAIQGRVTRFEVSWSALSTNTESSTVARRGAMFDLYRMTPRLCWLVVNQSWAAGPCAGLELGMVSGKGYGVSSFRTQRAFWLAASPGAMMELRLARSSVVSLNADLSIPSPWSDSFEISGERLFKPAVAGTLSVNLAAGWP